MSLQTSIRESGDVTIMDLRGKLTINGGESALLSDRLRESLGNGLRKLLLNLEGLSQVDSSGVAILIETYISLKRRHGDLKLLNPAGRVLQVLTVFRLLDVLPRFEDEAQAVASFAA